MKLVDTNILVYAADADSPHHVTSRNWIEHTLSNPSGMGMGMAWLSVVGFIRLATHPRIAKAPRSVPQALGYVHDWLAHPNVQLLQPTAHHADILARLLLAVGTAGNLTNDAHLAALAIEHHAEIATFDRDFKRFAGLQFQLLT